MPLASAQAFEEIVMKLSVLRYIFKSRSKRGLYDLNKQAERFFMDLINIVQGWNLVDLNIDTPNAPVIDLGDTPRQICMQVTAEDRSTKIKDTIKNFVEKKLYDKYNRIVFLMIAGKKNYSTDFPTDGKFSFSIADDVWDTDDLLEKIEILKVDKIQEINDFLNKELAPIVKIYAAPTSLLLRVEPVIDLPPVTTKKFLEFCQYEEGDPSWNNEFKIIKKFYNKLKGFSNEEREYLVLIVTRGKIKQRTGINRFCIAPSTLRSIYNSGTSHNQDYEGGYQADNGHFSVLEDAGLLTADGDHPPQVEMHWTMDCGEDLIVKMRQFCTDDKMLNRLFIEGNFTLLD